MNKVPETCDYDFVLLVKTMVLHAQLVSWPANINAEFLDYWEGDFKGNVLVCSWQCCILLSFWSPHQLNLSPVVPVIAA